MNGRDLIEHGKKESPLVSIVVPVYNVAAYLPKCLDSIFNQTYQNFEVILVNDGSEDGSTDICRDYAQKDRRVVLIEQNNQGVSAARNAALAKVRSEYITFLDSDDMFESEALETMLRSLRDNRADLCICGFIAKNPVRQISVNSFETDTIFSNKELVFKYVSTDMIPATICAKMYRAELLDGLSFPVGKIHEDAFLLPRIFHRVNRAVCIHDNLYIQNIRERSIMRSSFSPKYLDIIECEENTMSFISTYYPEFMDCVAYNRYNAIASVMAKIMMLGAYSENRDLYNELHNMLVQEYKDASPLVSKNTKIKPKYMGIVKHPFLFRIRFRGRRIIQQIKNVIKKLIQRVRG